MNIHFLILLILRHFEINSNINKLYATGQLVKTNENYDNLKYFLTDASQSILVMIYLVLLEQSDKFNNKGGPMAEFKVTLEKYAALCALMADTGGDESKEIEIALAQNVTAEDWKEAKTGYTALMQDPSDMGKTAMAFMPLFQEAQTRMRGGEAPGSLEDYTRIHAEMAFRKDPNDPEKKIDFMVVILENNYTHAKWLEMESYWTPRVATDENPKFNPEQAMKFREMMQKESDRILGIKR